MADMEMSLIHGSIIALACGLGKTLCALNPIRVRASRTEKGQHKAMLVDCPSSSVEV